MWVYYYTFFYSQKSAYDVKLHFLSLLLFNEDNVWSTENEFALTVKSYCKIFRMSTKDEEWSQDVLILFDRINIFGNKCSKYYEVEIV